MTELSVIIPTRGRPERLRACLRSLAEIRDEAEIEVLVTVDGAAKQERDVADEVLRGQVDYVVLDGPASGPAAARNRAITAATRPITLLLNDDVVCRPGLLAEHASAHDEAKRPAMILGSAPWAIRADDRLFDRMVRETSTVFFYDQMVGEQRGHRMRDWGFRHGWTLNLSLPTELARGLGFSERMPRPVYEDLEFAYRVRETSGAPVLFRPDAEVVHHHWYEPEELLRRDVLLGHQALALADVNPECAKEMFGRKLGGQTEHRFALQYVSRQRSLAVRSARLLGRSVSIGGGEAGTFALESLYEASLHARRWCWHAGLLGHLEGCTPDEQIPEVAEVLLAAKEATQRVRPEIPLHRLGVPA
ncbi:MAG: glycosyltransferase family A protein [Planctomycetota bacterium]